MLYKVYRVKDGKWTLIALTVHRSDARKVYEQWHSAVLICGDVIIDSKNLGREGE